MALAYVFVPLDFKPLYEKADASKCRGLVLTMRGLSKTAGCERANTPTAWSGLRESNPFGQLGRLEHDHYAKSAMI